ncbi:cupin domain-containing protein [Paeniglutamicibacter sp. R2-26]|uniref:cupin domain-containing protein n=1 Tax=Paeniglutamicibacter sp. R2-26 TaxID=3144417 RepID=UPI003EE519B1
MSIIENMNMTSINNPTVHAPSAALEHELVPADQSVAGDPTTAAERLGEVFGVEFGLWEMSAGIMTDVEAEELFVVLSGKATVQVHEANGYAAEVLQLEPGTVCRLGEGMRTTWILDEPLRKLYLTQS